MAAAGFVSCEGYLDVNNDPNELSEDVITTSMLLPGVEMNLTSVYNSRFHILGSYYSQHYAQMFGTSNYLSFSKFNGTAATTSSYYTYLATRCLNNIEIIYEKALADNEMGTYLAATVLRAFTYQVFVDMYDDIPYTEAQDLSNLSPAYDDGLTIYNGIIAELDNALSLYSADDLVCTNFLFGGTDVEPWVEFANALKLRILTRMSGVADVQSQLDALIAEGNFPSSDIQFEGMWSDEDSKQNPFFDSEFYTGTQDNCNANVAILETMKEVGDARLYAMFTGGDGDYQVGGVSGSNFTTTDTYYSAYCPRPIVTYDSPAVLLSVAETKFMIAEYYHNKGNDTQAKAYYEAAIEASFASWGVDGAENVYNSSVYAWDSSKAMELIGIQKWLSFINTNGYEAWCELRRIGYPAFDSSITGLSIYNETTAIYDADAYTPGTLYTPTLVEAEVGNNATIQRLYYPTSSTSANSNSPEQKLLSDPIFWAK